MAERSTSAIAGGAPRKFQPACCSAYRHIFSARCSSDIGCEAQPQTIGTTNMLASRRITVELSGARADVWAWHFIFHAPAPADWLGVLRNVDVSEVMIATHKALEQRELRMVT